MAAPRTQGWLLLCAAVVGMTIYYSQFHRWRQTHSALPYLASYTLLAAVPPLPCLPRLLTAALTLFCGGLVACRWWEGAGRAGGGPSAPPTTSCGSG